MEHEQIWLQFQIEAQPPQFLGESAEAPNQTPRPRRLDATPASQDLTEEKTARRREYLKRWRVGHPETREQIQKRVAWNREWREKNREITRQWARASRVKNADKIKRWQHEYYKANAEKIKKRVKEYTACNQDKAKTWKKTYNKEGRRLYFKTQRGTEEYKNRLAKWVVENRERIRKHKKKWKLNNPEALLSMSAKRRDAKKTACQGYNKLYVNSFYTISRRISECLRYPFHVDHIMPLARGGMHHQDNLQILSKKKNLSKGAKLIAS
jgi:hypothetical protein